MIGNFTHIKADELPVLAECIARDEQNMEKVQRKC
jgi:hypothetical protein